MRVSASRAFNDARTAGMLSASPVDPDRRVSPGDSAVRRSRRLYGMGTATGCRRAAPRRRCKPQPSIVSARRDRGDWSNIRGRSRCHSPIFTSRVHALSLRAATACQTRPGLWRNSSGFSRRASGLVFESRHPASRLRSTRYMRNSSLGACCELSAVELLGRLRDICIEDAAICGDDVPQAGEIPVDLGPT
jgi:hypothetical protein